MSDLTYDAKLIRPLSTALVPGAKVASNTGGLGDVVTIETDGRTAKSAGASGKGVGLVVATEKHASSGAYAVNEEVTLCTFGLVTGFSGLTPGKLVYLSATAGRLATTGSVPFGYAYDETTVFVMPGIANAAS